MSLQIGWSSFEFKNISLRLNNFSKCFGELKIVHLSDLHITKKIPPALLDELVAKINSQEPDLVLFTGDIIQTHARKIKKQLESFKNLKSKSYYVTGNHDIFYGHRELQEIMHQNGVFSLDNKVIKLSINGTLMQIIGLSDRYSFFRNIKRPLKELFLELDPILPTILLAHQPKDVYLIGKSRVDLQLSGHTHGGQIYPFSLVVKLFQPYFSGLYEHNKTTLYVSNGLGYWGVQMRYKAPKEITVLTIN